MNITDLPKDRIARALSSEIASTAIRLDFVAQIYFTEDVASGAGTPAATEYVQTLVHTSEFFRILESGMPESLARALAQNFFLASMHSTGISHSSFCAPTILKALLPECSGGKTRCRAIYCRFLVFKLLLNSLTDPLKMS